MLRQYSYTLDPTLLRETLEQFDLTLPAGGHQYALLEYKTVTPDSFIWKFLIEDSIYYLYAEDFIDSLDAVRESILRLSKDQSPFEFIKVKTAKDFDEAGPVAASEIYKHPDDYDNLKLYAADAGHDFAFLVRSEENPSDAFFAKY
jgi:hypothetical protein